MTLDTLRLARNLQRYDFSQQQAEGLAEALRDVVVEDIASKADIEALRKELKTDIEALCQETKADMAAMELRLIKWMLGTGVAGVIAVVGLLKAMLP